MQKITIDRDSLIAAHVTLDNHVATIAGRLLDFAYVVCLECTAHSASYSWDAVQRVVEKGGRFAT